MSDNHDSCGCHSCNVERLYNWMSGLGNIYHHRSSTFRWFDSNRRVLRFKSQWFRRNWCIDSMVAWTIIRRHSIETPEARCQRRSTAPSMILYCFTVEYPLGFRPYASRSLYPANGPVFPLSKRNSNHWTIADYFFTAIIVCFDGSSGFCSTAHSKMVRNVYRSQAYHQVRLFAKRPYPTIIHG